ncbi:substrate-binding domain-containing protein [Kribbella sp. VKM Ac-2566]|uniref:substrate-binding domain-containing protein n=1 Tax=Kribbella sp. VKM Ac-2566 TaxID=2512218 RepID=UPI001EDE57EB|nr:substrate-binding domain-containing protein [Kribbella sp. VKM Ac-2566]
MKNTVRSRWTMLSVWLVVATLVVVSCAGPHSSSSTGNALGNGSLPGKMAGDGTVTSPPLNDSAPRGAAAALEKYVPDSSIKLAYEGYWHYANLGPNPYATNWTPPKPPLHYCLSSAFLANNFTQSVSAKLQENVSALQSSGKATGALTITNSNFNIPLQASHINQLVDQGCHVIWVIDVAPKGLCNAMEKARQHGVLIVTVVTPVDCPDAINLSVSETEMGSLPATYLVHMLRGKGNVLAVTGLPGLAVTDQRLRAAKQVFSQAPGIKVVGEVRGDFTPSVAKSNVLKFLATHPQKIDAVIEGGSVGLAVAQAFDQAGRPRPLLGEVGATCGYLSYWRQQNLSSGFSMVFGGRGAGEELYAITQRLLNGEKLKGNLVLYPPIQITQSTLDSWHKPEYTLNSTCQAERPGDNRPYPDTYFDPLFEQP